MNRPCLPPRQGFSLLRTLEVCCREVVARQSRNVLPPRACVGSRSLSSSGSVGGGGRRVGGKQAEELNSARAKHNISSTWSDVRGTLTLSLAPHDGCSLQGFNIRNLTEKSKSINPNGSLGGQAWRPLSRGGGSGVTPGLFCSNYFSAKFKFGQILRPNLPVG